MPLLTSSPHELALQPLDLDLEELAAKTQGGIAALRYADDLLVLARDDRLARDAIACARQTLATLRQSLRTPIHLSRTVEEGADWLGVHLQPRPHRLLGRVTFGYVVPEAKVQGMLERIVEMTTPPSNRIDASAFNLGRWIVSINTQLRDWRQAYLYADNAPQVFAALDDHTRDRVGLLMHAVTGKRFPELRDTYRVRLPRGFWTWQVDGVRLTVLSSLAPHAPDRLTFKPPWMRVKLPPEPRMPTPPKSGTNEEHIP